MKKQQRKINTNQLYAEPHFISYCSVDERSSSGKLGVFINPAFLQACEKDGLIKPLHSEEQKQMTATGEMTILAKLYSPFQIFWVSALSKNIVDEEGLLRTTEFGGLEYQKEQKTRFISWGDWSAFNVDSEKAGSIPPPGGVNHFVFAEDFHNFLKLLHSLETMDVFKHYDYDKIRLYQGAPQLEYDLQPIRDDKNILSAYALTTQKLEIILRNVGRYALHIDPLEEWYYYIQKHPQRRRDELKGLASVAQDLYGFCNILTGMIEILTDKELPPFLEFIYSDFPMTSRDKRNQYADGEDILAIKAAHVKLIEWMTRNKDFLERIALLPGNERLTNIATFTKKTGQELDNFQKRYGDVRYVGNYRMIYPSDKKITELDPVTKSYAEMRINSRMNRKGQDEDTDDEEDASTEMDFSGSDISSAIAMRLGDLKRQVAEPAYRISEALYKEDYRIENEKRQSVSKIQLEYFKSDTGNENPQTKHTLFWRDVLPKAQKVYDDELKSVNRLRAELNGIGNATRIVFCAECRKNPVMLHQEYNDGALSREAICDECISNASLNIRTIRSGAWNCDYCGKKIYQFAHGNILGDVLRNSVPATITLNYGRVQIEVNCQNKKCGQKQSKIIDWGWLP